MTTIATTPWTTINPSMMHDDIPELPVGHVLLQQRQERGWSIDEASQATACFRSYICAFEENKLPPSLSLWHARYIFRRYASKLGLPWELLWDQFMRQKGVVASDEARTIQRTPPITQNIVMSISTLRYASAIVAVVSVVALLGWYVVQTFLPPSVTIQWPLNRMITQDAHVTVVGFVSPSSSLWINGESFIVGNGGVFRKEVYLHPGVNTIRVAAQKPHSAQQVQERIVYVNNPSPLVEGSPNP